MKTPVIDQFFGGPLDAAKLAAATFMVADHVNLILFEGEVSILRWFGRMALPLFCFVLACHLTRGINIWKHVSRLILFGVLSQPIYSWAFSGAYSGNIFFTLAVGATVTEFLSRQNSLRQHFLLALGTAGVFLIPFSARSGVDFGLAGMLFIAPVFLVLSGRLGHVVWLLLLAFGLHAGVDRPIDLAWVKDGLIDVAIVTVGTFAVLAVCMMFIGRRRFMPQYALYAFYPAHLAVLASIQNLMS